MMLFTNITDEILIQKYDEAKALGHTISYDPATATQAQKVRTVYDLILASKQLLASVGIQDPDTKELSEKDIAFLAEAKKVTDYATLAYEFPVLPGYMKLLELIMKRTEESACGGNLHEQFADITRQARAYADGAIEWIKGRCDEETDLVQITNFARSKGYCPGFVGFPVLSIMRAEDCDKMVSTISKNLKSRKSGDVISSLLIDNRFVNSFVHTTCVTSIPIFFTIFPDRLVSQVRKHLSYGIRRQNFNSGQYKGFEPYSKVNDIGKLEFWRKGTAPKGKGQDREEKGKGTSDRAERTESEQNAKSEYDDANEFNEDCSDAELPHATSNPQEDEESRSADDSNIGTGRWHRRRHKRQPTDEEPEVERQIELETQPKGGPHDESQTSDQDDIDEHFLDDLHQRAKEYIEEYAPNESLPMHLDHLERFETRSIEPRRVHFVDITDDDIMITLNDSSRAIMYILTFVRDTRKPVFNQVIHPRRNRFS